MCLDLYPPLSATMSTAEELIARCIAPVKQDFIIPRDAADRPAPLNNAAKATAGNDTAQERNAVMPAKSKRQQRKVRYA